MNNAAAVLSCYGAGCTDVTVTEVSERLGLPKASSSRLLRAMREAGMLETIGGTRRHRPGRMMLDLAAAFRHSSSLISRASEVVVTATRQFGHTGYISLLDGREVTAVADFEGTNLLRVVSNIGRRLPAHLSATGRSLLARMSDEEVRRLYDGAPEAKVLLRELARVRSQGFAVSEQESTEGVDGIAVAVGDPSTNEAIALCIVFPHALVGEPERDRMIAALGDGAEEIARSLGDRAFIPPKLENRITT
ncbi:IclR family transcriptional regulator [uncultured Jannaschia sp.]|uniref:IclR family transcriptional regulator n=1 Tax=uncultured Jannaschia sp. TaxID=293347 RepID=UPI00261A74DB|nr:IclR family transcriptional regulator [uncultured Jannaschia sp.]